MSEREALAEERAYFDGAGGVASYAFLRAMARAESGAATLVELKAVDGGYPVYGRLLTRPQQAPAELFALKDGAYGVVADPALTEVTRKFVQESPPFVTSTPTFLIDGKDVDQTMEALSAAIDEQLAKAQPASPAQ